MSTWSAAAHQLFVSLSLSFGGLITYSSYNKFTDKVHYTALLMPVLNFGISVMASVVFFAFVAQGKVERLKNNTNGLDLVFVALPEAILQLEIPQLWTVLLFVMLFFMGLNGVNAAIQTILTGFYDIFDVSRGGYKTLVSLIACCICYLLR